MDFDNVITSRHTVRKFTDFVPPREDIEKIINSARLAPSAKNLQNHKFVAVYDNDIKQKMRTEIEKCYDRIAESETSRNNKKIIITSKNYSVFFTEAPVVIAAVELPYSSETFDIIAEYYPDKNELKENRPDASLLSMGGAIENMILSATSLGYGTCWMVAPVLGSSVYKKFLGLADDEKIVSLIALGKPLHNNITGPSKKSLVEIMKII